MKNKNKMPLSIDILRLILDGGKMEDDKLQSVDMCQLMRYTIDKQNIKDLYAFAVEKNYIFIIKWIAARNDAEAQKYLMTVHYNNWQPFQY